MIGITFKKTATISIIGLKKKIMARETVSEALQRLSNDFIRIQKSYTIIDFTLLFF